LKYDKCTVFFKYEECTSEPRYNVATQKQVSNSKRTKEVHMENLTLNQKKVLDFIKKYQQKSGTTPTYDVIAKNFGYSAKSTVQHYVEALISKGYLTKERYLSHGITLHTEGNLIPLLGKVAAGLPIEHKKHDERIEVPLTMLKGTGPYFALQVSGDSMIDEGILDGDIVIIKQQADATNGDIVVAEIDNEATIKRYYKKKNHIELHSANPNYKPIIVAAGTPLKISGIYRGLIRHS
jgi:repressor LexA